MVALTGQTNTEISSKPQVAGAPVRAPRRIGMAPTASMIVGAVFAMWWLWVPFFIMMDWITTYGRAFDVTSIRGTISSAVFSAIGRPIPRAIGLAIAIVVFVYVMRGVGWVERMRSQAVFGMGIPVPPRRSASGRDIGPRVSPYAGIKRWLHQLWLDISSGWFWKGCAHHALRSIYDAAAAGVALALLVFAILGPVAMIAVTGSNFPGVQLPWVPVPLAFVLAVVALIVAVAILVFAPALDAVIDQWLLSPSQTAALQQQVHALADARHGAVSAAQTERYRIERDLHDGVQPRLVALAMTIGLAQTKLDSDPPAVRALITEAAGDAKTALAELRNVVRGIAPAILSDRGLDAALSSVVGRCAVPATLDIHLPRRLPDEVESVAYFVVAEAVTNVAKHAQATQAVVTVRLDETTNMLHVSVFDDGRGGAQITDGSDTTGLRGLAERVRAARGTFTVASPATGPTIATAVLPCES